jgi:hypothetical protein
MRRWTCRCIIGGSRLRDRAICPLTAESTPEKTETNASHTPSGRQRHSSRLYTSPRQPACSFAPLRQRPTMPSSASDVLTEHFL